MRAFAILLASSLPAAGMAVPAQIDVGRSRVVVIRPVESWDPNETTADYSLDSLRSKNFSFQYYDASGAKIVPRGEGWFHEKLATPLSDEVAKIMADNGYGNEGSHVYTISGPIRLQPNQMGDFIKAQNELYRATVIQQGDPTTLASRIASRKAVNLFATIALGAFGADKLSASAVSVSQYSTLYSDIAKLSHGASAALLPIPLPDVDFTGFAEVDIRCVTDNAGHVGEIVIGYRYPKTDAAEQGALAQGIAAAGGIGTTVEEVIAIRAKNYAQRLAIWSECQAMPTCP